MLNLRDYCTDIFNVYRLITLFACLGLIVSSLEFLSINHHFKVDGIFSWKVLSSRTIHQRKKLTKFDFLFQHSTVIVLLTIRILACCFLPFADAITLKVFLNAIVVIISMIFFYRNIFGNDGSDQMNYIIIVTTLIAFSINDIFTYKICIIFIAIQSLLAYVVAGVAKLISKRWRNGNAVFEIMNTETYGNQTMAKFLHTSHPVINYILCWGVILFECLFFLVLFLPFPYFLFFLAGGILFHIYNALTMGLNNFFVVFLATYPAIIYVNHLIIVR